MNYRVAAIQFEPALGEKGRNIDALLRLTEEAMQQGARLVVLPEMATTGYCWQSRAEIAPFVEPVPGPTTDQFQQLAVRYQSLVAVALPEVDPHTQVYYNSMALVGPEGVIGTYRKIHSYISEPRWARDGDLGVPVWETPLGKLSGLICMDAMYFESARLSALRGADVLLFPTNWVDDEPHPSSWWMARAFENGVYLIAANRYGNERGVPFSGGSCIINPDGSIQASCATGDGIVYGEIDLARCREKRWGHSAIGNRIADRRPQSYIPLTHNTYLWEPLRYHGLYELGELPPGQLSGTAILQTHLQDFVQPETRSRDELIAFVHDMVHTLVKDTGTAQPDVLVLPELLFPGPQQVTSDEAFGAHIRDGAISIPGPETTAIATLADELQASIVLGVAERDGDHYYNTVLLIDPAGVYGKYRKLHLTAQDRLWATPGDLGLPTFDTPVGRIGLATGYDVLFPETVRVLACQGVDLVCAPALLDFPDPISFTSESPEKVRTLTSVVDTLTEEEQRQHYVLWRIRAAEHNVYLALANWSGEAGTLRANGYSGIFPPATAIHPWSEVIVEEDEMGETLLSVMTVDTREQRTGRRTTQALGYTPGDLAGSLTGELDYDVRDSIPGNAVRGKPFLRKRQLYWYLDLVRDNKQ
jgi:predicted amidohydrolase